VAKGYSLRSTKEQIKVAELKANTLAGGPNELVGTGQILGVDARVRGGEDDSGALHPGVHRERAGCVRLGGAHFVLGCTRCTVTERKHTQTQIDSAHTPTQAPSFALWMR
jgi:hypothetical protein